MSALFFFAALATVVVAPGRAHVFYLQPSDLAPRAGERVTLGLFVGDPFAGDPVPRSHELMLDFLAWDAAGRSTPVRGVPRVHPAGLLTFDGEPLVITYRGRPQRVELAAHGFADYLFEEGQEEALRAWRAAPAADGVEKELFERCAKAVLGQPAARQLALPTGCELELTASGPRRLELTFRGKALPRHQVRLWSREREEVLITDGSGQFEIPRSLRDGAAVVVHAVLVRRAGMPPSSGRWEGWQSWWTSLVLLPEVLEGVAPIPAQATP